MQMKLYYMNMNINKGCIMDKFKTRDGAFNIGINVEINKRNKKTGRIIESRKVHNRCLRLQLLALAKFLNGEFNSTTNDYQVIESWIPRYLGVGTNVASPDSQSSITTSVQVNDTRLLSEISPRMKLQDKHKIVNRATQSYIQLIISTYLPEHLYNGYTIKEAGLFSKPTGNNCLFRVVFDGIQKTEDSVVEVNWTISIISVDSHNQPYEEVDKSDLKLSIDTMLDRFVALYGNFAEPCAKLKNAIEEYANLTATQETVDEDTASMSEINARMVDWPELTERT